MVDASATITGEYPNQKLNLVIPRGQKGEPGKDGSNVLPTQEAMTQEIEDENSPVHAALSAAIASATTPVLREAYRPAYPSEDWVHFGDSMTAAGWSDLLPAVTGRKHMNAGIGAQTSAQIAARQGGIPAVLTAQVALPATGGVTVNLTPNPVRDGAQYNRAGNLGGVDGVLSQSGSALTFTRDYPGAAGTIPAGTPFYTVEGETTRDRTATIWIGRNDNLTAPNAAEAIIERIRAMLEYIGPRFKRVLILGITPWDYEPLGTAGRIALDGVNAKIADAFPQHWVDIGAFLRSEAAATAVGIKFTAQDYTDIANGVTPSSFRYDAGHPDGDGARAIAVKVFEEARARGWIIYAPPAPPVELEALYLPGSWNSLTGTWEDASGHGHNLKSYLGKAPAKLTEGGATFLRFDGTKNVYTFDFPLPQPFTIYGVMRVRAYPATSRGVMVNVTTSNNAMWAPSIHASGLISVRSGSVDTFTKPPTETIDTTAWHGHGAVFNGASTLGELDGVETVSSGVTNADGMTRLGIATGNGNVDAPLLNADIAAIAIAPTALTQTQRNELRTYLLAQAGISA